MPTAIQSAPVPGLPTLPDGPATLETRIALRLMAEQRAEFRAKIIDRCRQDPAWFVDYFGMTLDPRIQGLGAIRPFFLYPFQRDLIREFKERIDLGQDLLVEKSRDMGVTWVGVSILVHQWLFRPAFQALLGSRKQDYVDNGQPDSLFGKVSWFLDYLPGWILPRGFSPKKHRRYAKLINPANGSTLLGESSNPNFGRGGRFSVIFLDEAAYWPDMDSVWRSTGSSSPCRVLVSTPNGRNAFARIRFSGQIDVNTVHWSLHPHRDQAWYEAECKRLIDPVTIAQELDISYDRSVAGLVYPNWPDAPKGFYPLQPNWPLFVAIDFGISDPTAMIWAQRDPKSRKVRLIDCYTNRGKPADFYIPFVTGEIPADSPYQYTPTELDQIGEHSLWGTPVVYGDPSGKARSQATGDSVLDIWSQYGVSIKCKPDAIKFPPRYQATQLLIRDLEVNLPACGELDLALSSARFPERRLDSSSTSELERPIHDWTSHFRTALEYLAVNLPKTHRHRPPAPTRRPMAYDRM